MQIKQTRVQYPDVMLKLSETPKLRGFFGNKYIDEVLMHNHNGDGFRYKYPLVQYKIVHGAPTIIGLEAGAELVLNAGFRESELVIGEKHINSGRIEVVNELAEFGLTKEIHNYEFVMPWIALNEKNLEIYKHTDEIGIEVLLESILKGNLISMSKGLHYDVPGEIRVRANVEAIDVYPKGVKMYGFVGGFKANFALPEYIGVGRLVSCGFGAVVECDKL